MLIVRMVSHVRARCAKSDNLGAQQKTIWVLSKVLEYHLPFCCKRNDETFEIEDNSNYGHVDGALKAAGGGGWWAPLCGCLLGGGGGGGDGGDPHRDVSAEQALADAKTAHRAKQHEMSEYGCSELVVDVVGASKDMRLVREAIKLGVELLEFGNEGRFVSYFSDGAILSYFGRVDCF